MTNNGDVSSSLQVVEWGERNEKVFLKRPLPVDRGWAWVVMFGIFFNVCFIMLFIRSSSVLFIQFLEKYQESATMTTLAFGLSAAMFALCNICGPAFLLHRFEVRTLVLFGSVINFLSIFSIAFAPNMIVIDVIFACIGFAHGLIFVPQMTLIGHYFNKRLSFASAFVNLGLSIGTITGPPMVQYFLDNYGLQGAIMILAGINLNCIPASMVFRSVSNYEDPHSNNTQDEQFEVRHVYGTNDFNSAEEVASMIQEVEFVKHSVVRSGSEIEHNEASKTSNGDGVADQSNSYVSLNVSEPRESKVSDVIDRISMSTSIRYLTDSSLFLEDVLPSEKKILGKRYFEREDSLVEVTVVDEISVASETVKQARNTNVTHLSKIRKSIAESIYVHPLGILILLASGLGVHTQTVIAYMPATGKENGLTDNEIPYLVTVIGVCDLISKLGIGVFADLGYVRRIHITTASAIVCGTVMQFVSLFEGFGLMVLLQVLLGVTVGVTHAMLAVIVVDILGVKHMGHIMAGYFLVNGCVMSVEHIAIGSIKDYTGSFFIAYNYIGSFILLSAFLFLLEPLIARIKPAPK